MVTKEDKRWAYLDASVMANGVCVRLYRPMVCWYVFVRAQVGPSKDFT